MPLSTHSNTARQQQNKQHKKNKFVELRTALAKRFEFDILFWLIRNNPKFNYTAARVAAEQTGWSIKSAQRAFKSLEDLELIYREPNRTGQRKRVIIWKINWSKLNELIQMPDAFQPDIKLVRQSKLGLPVPIDNSKPEKTHLPIKGLEEIPPPDKQTRLDSDDLYKPLPFDDRREVPQDEWRSVVKLPTKTPRRKPRAKLSDAERDAMRLISSGSRKGPEDRVWSGNTYGDAHQNRKIEFKNGFARFMDYSPSFDTVEKWMRVFTPNELREILRALEIKAQHRTDGHRRLLPMLLADRVILGDWKKLFTFLLKKN